MPTYINRMPMHIYRIILAYARAEVLEQLKSIQGYVLLPPSSVHSRRTGGIGQRFGRVAPIMNGFISTWDGAKLKGDEARMFVNMYLPHLGQHCDGMHLKSNPSDYGHFPVFEGGVYIYCPDIIVKERRILKTLYAVITYTTPNTVPVNCMALSSQIAYKMSLAMYSPLTWTRTVNVSHLALEEYLLDICIF